MKYRKKPVIVEAIQYKEDNLQEIMDFVGPSLRVDGSCSAAETGMKIRHDVYIHTLEGDMHVDYLDFVIKGVHGEFYPCKPNIFEKTYEPVADENKEIAW